MPDADGELERRRNRQSPSNSTPYKSYKLHRTVFGFEPWQSVGVKEHKELDVGLRGQSADKRSRDRWRQICKTSLVKVTAWLPI